VLFDGAKRASTTTQFQFSTENSNAAPPFTSCGPDCAFLAYSKLLLKSVTTEYTQELLFSVSASNACLKTLPRKVRLCGVKKAQVSL